MKLNIITIYKNGLKNNYKELLDNKLYNKDHGASYFKYLYNNFEKENKDITTIIAYSIEDGNPIGVLLFEHYKNKSINSYKLRTYCLIGKIGIYIKPEFRNNGIAKKLILEFENNFIDKYSENIDYILVDAYQAVYEIAFKHFKFFISNNNNLSDTYIINNIKKSINLKGTMSLKYYLYKILKNKKI